MNGTLYFLDFFSNLHVGGTGNDFSIVDLQVQRDPISDRPAIYASSLKGALRSHAVAQQSTDIDLIFGQDLDADGRTKQGAVSFTDAHLLLYPLRTNQCSYILAASPAMLQDFVCQLALLGLGNSPLADACNALVAKATEAWTRIPSVNKPALLFGNKTQGILRAESKLTEYLAAPEIDLSVLPTKPNQLLLVSDKDMKMYLESLPVMAHNRLKNGVSEALWYEEIVPRKSVFFTMTFTDNAIAANALSALLNGYIQIGANATLGYGICNFIAHK